MTLLHQQNGMFDNTQILLFHSILLFIVVCECVCVCVCVVCVCPCRAQQ